MSMSSQQALTIEQFCQRYQISRAMFYKLQAQGLAPQTLKLGRAVRIASSAMLTWEQAMQADQPVLVARD